MYKWRLPQLITQLIMMMATSILDRLEIYHLNYISKHFDDYAWLLRIFYSLDMGNKTVTYFITKKRLWLQIWKHELAFLKPDPLPDDIVLYSAWDVEPLLDIYHITSSIIEPDFEPLMKVIDLLHFWRRTILSTSSVAEG